MCVIHVDPYVNMHVFLCTHKLLCVCPSCGVMIDCIGVCGVGVLVGKSCISLGLWLSG